jgi:hypothetical protein
LPDQAEFHLFAPSAGHKDTSRRLLPATLPRYESTTQGLSLNFDVIDYTLANQRRNRRQNYTQNRMIPQSLRPISASMTASEEKHRGFCVPEFSAAFIADSKPLL